ncbi:hypothetical protein [Streptococcus acidominimus]|uniref:hypothetical protein n=1 Tax=Streptococcus acidominimus TaxID=1326 RepID=UPI001D163294|nr:hypothetical protein [Streptococcus acidominimus]
MQQRLLVNAVKAASQEVERAFVLANFKEDEECFDFFYQIEGHLLYWQELGEEARHKIESQFLPQAQEVVALFIQILIRQVCLGLLMRCYSLNRRLWRGLVDD